MAVNWLRVSLLTLAMSADGAAHAASLNEDIAGDISNNRLAPTSFMLQSGSNFVDGHFGRVSGGVGRDLDYLHIAIPTGYQLTHLFVRPGSTSGGIRSFIGVQAGTIFSVPANVADASELLGYTHFTPSFVSYDILPEMGDAFGAAFGAQGFSAPLFGPSYTFWVEETQADAIYDYRFDFQVSPIPLPTPLAGFVAALAILATRLRGGAQSLNTRT